QQIWYMVMPFYNSIASMADITVLLNNSYILLRLLADHPHISLSDLHTIKCPTLVIGGDHDLIREEHTFLIYKNIPKAYLWILPASGHSTPLIYKDDFNTVVGRFFKNPYKVIEGEGRFQ
ncbi:MAG: alpha/beta hydrolase, partial [Chitinophagaceae bacterium]|nr:alpha/beta hydrolase [Chitinophagaceae bacterium]